MATQATSARNKIKNVEMAARMKRLGIRRTTARCPVCYRIVGIPLDRHLFGGNCN